MSTTETKPFNKLTIAMGDDEYVFSGGGGSQPAPHSVGHEEMQADAVGSENIIDGAVEMNDLHEQVRQNLTPVYHEEDEGLTLGGFAPNV